MGARAARLEEFPSRVARAGAPYGGQTAVPPVPPYLGGQPEEQDDSSVFRPLLTGLDYALRPWYTIKAGLYHLTDPEYTSAQAVQDALAGQYKPTNADLIRHGIRAAGGVPDPNSKWISGLGMAMDFVDPLDPLNYIGGGFSKAGHLIKTARRFGEGAQKLTRVAAAKKGQWHALRFGRVPLTPQAVNLPAAAGMDKIARGMGSVARRTHLDVLGRKIRSKVGGKDKKWNDFFAASAHIKELTIAQQMAVHGTLERMIKDPNTPEAARVMGTHILESKNPNDLIEKLSKGGTLSIREVRDYTAEDVLNFQEAMIPHMKLHEAHAEALRGVVRAGIDAYSEQLQKFGTKEYEVISEGQLAAKVREAWDAKAVTDPTIRSLMREGQDSDLMLEHALIKAIRQDESGSLADMLVKFIDPEGEFAGMILQKDWRKLNNRAKVPGKAAAKAALKFVKNAGDDPRELERIFGRTNMDELLRDRPLMILSRGLTEGPGTPKLSSLMQERAVNEILPLYRDYVDDLTVDPLGVEGFLKFYRDTMKGAGPKAKRGPEKTIRKIFDTMEMHVRHSAAPLDFAEQSLIKAKLAGTKLFDDPIQRWQEQRRLMTELFQTNVKGLNGYAEGRFATPSMVAARKQEVAEQLLDVENILRSEIKIKAGDEGTAEGMREFLRGYGLPEHEVNAFSTIADARANTYAAANGLSPEDWYRTRFAGWEHELPVGALGDEPLFQTGPIRDAMQALGAMAPKSVGKLTTRLENMADGLEAFAVKQWEAAGLKGKVKGKIDPLKNPQHRETMKTWMRREFEYQESRPGFKRGWYKRSVRKAFKKLAQRYPAITKKNSTERHVMETLMAIGSNGQEVMTNVPIAMKLYEAWDEGGRFAARQLGGMHHSSRPAMADAAHRLNKLVDEMGGIEAAMKWLREKHPNSELRKWNKSGIEGPANMEQLGAKILGPKIGSFFGNITGLDMTDVTVDVWMMRQWNRYKGDVRVPGKLGEDAARGTPKSPTEREAVKAMVREIARENSIDPPEVQAALWYYEQELYRELGYPTQPANFEDAVDAALQRFGLTDKIKTVRPFQELVDRPPYVDATVQRAGQESALGRALAVQQGMAGPDVSVLTIASKPGGAGFTDLDVPMERIGEYHQEIWKSIMSKDGRSIPALSRLGLNHQVVMTRGSWAGQTSGGMEDVFSVVIRGSTPQETEHAAALMGSALGQEMAAWHRPLDFPAAIKHGRNLDAAKQWARLQGVKNEDVFTVVRVEKPSKGQWSNAEIDAFNKAIAPDPKKPLGWSLSVDRRSIDFVHYPFEMDEATWVRGVAAGLKRYKRKISTYHEYFAGGAVGKELGDGRDYASVIGRTRDNLRTRKRSGTQGVQQDLYNDLYAPVEGVRKRWESAAAAGGRGPEPLAQFATTAAERRGELSEMGAFLPQRRFPKGMKEATDVDLAGDLGKQGVRGWARFMEDSRAIIGALQQGDVSTAIHEIFGHVLRRDLVGKDRLVAETYFGVKNGNWTKTHEEAFARTMERYFREGPKAAPKELRGPFRVLTQAMRHIYSRLTGTSIDVPIHPDIAEVFDRMLFGAGDIDPVSATHLREKLLKERELLDNGLWGEVNKSPAYNKFSEEEALRLLAENKQITEALQNGDPLAFWMQASKVAEKKLTSTLPPRYTIKDIALPGMSPDKVQAALRVANQISPILDDIRKLFTDRGPDFARFSNVLDYAGVHLPHIPKEKSPKGLIGIKPKSRLIESQGKAYTVADMEKAIRERAGTDRPWLQGPELDAVVRQEMDAMTGFDMHRINGAGTGEYDTFKRRMLPFTLYELENSVLGGEFEADAVILANEAYRTASNWAHGYDLMNWIKKSQYAKSQPGKGLVEMKYFVPAVDKNPFQGTYIPKDLHDYATGMMKAVHKMTDDDGVSFIFQQLHTMRHWWSAWTLAPFPGYHARNLVSNIFLAHIGDLNPLTKGGAQAWKAGAEVVMPKGIPGVSERATLRAIADEIGQNLPGEVVSPDSLIHSMMTRQVIGVSMRDLTDFDPARAGQVMGKLKISHIFHPNPDKNLLIHLGFKGGRKNEDMARSALFIDRLRKTSKLAAEEGFTYDQLLQDATAWVNKHLYDYTDLTPFENKTLKALFPFYTFVSKNVPHMFQTLATNPKKFLPLAHLYSGAYAEFDDVDPDDIPEWQQKAGGMPVHRYTDPEDGDERVAIWMGRGWLPYLDIAEVADAVRGTYATVRNATYGAYTGEYKSNRGSGIGEYIVQQLTPFLKEPLEQIMDQDTFTGRSIVGDKEGEVKDVFGFAVHPRVQHALKNIRLISELDRLNPSLGLVDKGIWTQIGIKTGAWDKDIDARPHRHEVPEGGRILRSLTGLASYSVNPEEHLSREVKKLTNESRTALYLRRRARKDGNLLEANNYFTQFLDLKKERRQLSSRLSFWRGMNAVPAGERLNYRGNIKKQD